MKLTLIRGLPGSGKSTLAKKQPAIHFEADMFFINNQAYCYEPTLITQAHQWCEQQVAQALKQGRSVVVSNTFIKWWQIEPYIYLAKRHAISVKLIEAKGDYQNIHAVPELIISKMKIDYESNAAIIAKIVKIIPISQLCLA